MKKFPIAAVCCLALWASPASAQCAACGTATKVSVSVRPGLFAGLASRHEARVERREARHHKTTVSVSATVGGPCATGVCPLPTAPVPAKK